MVSSIASSRRSWRDRQMFAGKGTPLYANASEPKSEMRNSSDIPFIPHAPAISTYDALHHEYTIS
jgi:hypothetical protein